LYFSYALSKWKVIEVPAIVHAVTHAHTKTIAQIAEIAHIAEDQDVVVHHADMLNKRINLFI
jgi:hypothetical protein